MKICLVVPCYNESERLKKNLFLDFAKAHSDVVILFVNDGSRDKTVEMLNGMKSLSENIQVLDLVENQGKAEAVRQGVLWATKNISEIQAVGFWDADLATPLQEVPRFIKYLDENPQFRVIFGSRILKLGNQIRRRALRHYLGRIFATAVSLMTGVKVYDTQCGAKVFLLETIPVLFSEKFVSRWFFDVELLIRFEKKIGDPHLEIFELPLKFWRDEGGSKLKSTDFLKAPLELLKIYRHYQGK